MTSPTHTYACPRRRPGTAPPTGPRWVGWYFVVVGAGVAGLWVTSLPGAFDDGLFAYAGTATAGNVPVFHVTAEGLMAATALAAGIALLRRGRHGRAVAFVANGMLMYSAVNSSGWLLHHQPGVLLVTGATLVGALVSTWTLLHGRQP